MFLLTTIHGIPVFPTAASTAAIQQDRLAWFLLLVTGGITLFIAVLIVTFAIRYGEHRHPQAVQIEGNNLLELGWTAATLVIFMVMFFWGARLYYHEYTEPPHAIHINVIAKQWMWKFQHAEGQREIDELHVPVNRPVVLTMISQDVIHSFFVPAFRLKKDVLPGRYRDLWFQADKIGKYQLFCSQYCGAEHSRMRGTVYVMSQADYAKWLQNSGAMGSAAYDGERLFQDLACITCHRADSTARGPNLVGLYGRTVHLNDGSTVLADDNYIRESILYPNAKIVAGFEPIMPTFRGQIDESQLLDLVEYIKSLKTQQQLEPYNNRSAPPNGPRPTESRTQQP